LCGFSCWTLEIFLLIYLFWVEAMDALDRVCNLRDSSLNKHARCPVN
jgi:hypothetical protein